MHKLFLFIAIGILTAIGLSSLDIREILKPGPKETAVKKTIPAGATFGKLAGELGLATATIDKLIAVSEKEYNLAKIVEGRELALVFSNLEKDADEPLKKLIYKINTDEELTVEKNETGEWQAEVAPIPYEIKEKKVSGIIQTSLYETMQENNLDTRLALALAETFAWQIDFAADIQKNDSFKAVYGERYLDGQYVMPGKILGAEFVNNGKVFRGYYFAGNNTKEGYYDDDGNSLQKQFLKSPLQYKYISSGFSYGRYNPITKKVSPHRGIDYAANYGTPAVAVGDGTVTQAGWNGYYGISATIRHNDTYRTVYGHFANLAKGIYVGAKVKQGQVVGYVGSTGQATGPHLHYEMHKFGGHVNPFLVEIPPGEPIAEADRQFFEQKKAATLAALE